MFFPSLSRCRARRRFVTNRDKICIEVGVRSTTTQVGIFLSTRPKRQSALSSGLYCLLNILLLWRLVVNLSKSMYLYTLKECRRKDVFLLCISARGLCNLYARAHSQLALKHCQINGDMCS